MIRLQWDADEGDADIILQASGTDTTRPLETAIMLSLFCDAPSTETEDRRGYWADVYSDDADTWGSKLWLMFSRKATNASLQEARKFCETALQWMIDDGIARQVDVETWWIEGRKGYLGILVTLYKPNDPAPQYAGPWKVYYGLD